jgi:hypothetical protein
VLNWAKSQKTSFDLIGVCNQPERMQWLLDHDETAVSAEILARWLALCRNWIMS